MDFETWLKVKPLLLSEQHDLRSQGLEMCLLFPPTKDQWSSVRGWVLPDWSTDWCQEALTVDREAGYTELPGLWADRPLSETCLEDFHGYEDIDSLIVGRLDSAETIDVTDWIRALSTVQRIRVLDVSGLVEMDPSSLRARVDTIKVRGDMLPDWICHLKCSTLRISYPRPQRTLDSVEIEERVAMVARTHLSITGRRVILPESILYGDKGPRNILVTSDQQSPKIIPVSVPWT